MASGPSLKTFVSRALGLKNIALGIMLLFSCYTAVAAERLKILFGDWTIFEVELLPSDGAQIDNKDELIGKSLHIDSRKVEWEKGFPFLSKKSGYVYFPISSQKKVPCLVVLCSSIYLAMEKGNLEILRSSRSWRE